MEHFILGLLMLHKLTAYELHVQIRDNYEGICSHSIGNIQRALKKLHEKGLVALEEVREGKVIKKIFGITPEGRAHFMKWLNHPIAITKVKNMELGRLLLLGFLTKEQQLANIDRVIQDLKEASEYMKAVEAAIKAEIKEAGDIEQARLDHFNEHEDYMEDLLNSVETDDYLDLLRNVNKFGILTFQHGVAEIKFNLEWFENLRKELSEELD